MYPFQRLLVNLARGFAKNLLAEEEKLLRGENSFRELLPGGSRGNGGR